MNRGRVSCLHDRLEPAVLPGNGPSRRGRRAQRAA